MILINNNNEINYFDNSNIICNMHQTIKQRQRQQRHTRNFLEMNSSEKRIWAKFLNLSPVFCEFMGIKQR